MTDKQEEVVVALMSASLVIDHVADLLESFESEPQGKRKEGLALDVLEETDEIVQRLEQMVEAIEQIEQVGDATEWQRWVGITKEIRAVFVAWKTKRDETWAGWRAKADAMDPCSKQEKAKNYEFPRGWDEDRAKELFARYRARENAKIEEGQ